MQRVTKLSILLILAIFNFDVNAQDKELSSQYIIPDAPAYTFLGVSPANISRPTTPRSFGSALINGIDPEGRVKQGVSLDVTPWVLISPTSIPLSDYQSNTLKFILANTQFSLATTKTAIQQENTDLAWGIRIVIFDKSDPMRDSNFTSKFGNDAMIICPPIADPGQVAKRAECIEATLDSLRKDWLKNNWNKPSLAVAAAGGTRFNQTLFKNADNIGESVWITGGLPITKYGQLLLQGKYDLLQLPLNDNINLNRLSYGGRLIIGTSTFNLYGELNGIRNFDTEELPELDENDLTWSGGIEFRVSDNLWLATGVGEGYTAFGESDSSFLLANLRWDILSKPRFK